LNTSGGPFRSRRQDHRVGSAPDGLGELTAPPRSRRSPGRADEAAHGVAFHYSDMSMRTMACSSSKRNSASARASSVLPTPSGRGRGTSRWAVRVREAGTTAADGVGHRRDGLVLAHHTGVEEVLHAHSLSTSPSSSLVTGTPVQRLTTSATSSRRLLLQERWEVWELGQLGGRLVDAALELGDLAVAITEAP